MDEDLLKGIDIRLSDIEKKLGAGIGSMIKESIGDLGNLWGPVADPGPSIGIRDPRLQHLIKPTERMKIYDYCDWVGDPALSPNLSEMMRAKLFIKKLEMNIGILKKDIEYLELQKELIKEEFLK